MPAKYSTMEQVLHQAISVAIAEGKTRQDVEKLRFSDGANAALKESLLGTIATEFDKRFPGAAGDPSSLPEAEVDQFAAKQSEWIAGGLNKLAGQTG
jgi:hypothetical protein